MKRLVQEGLLVLLVRGGHAVTAFGLTYVVALVLGAEGSGVYYLAVSVGTITSVLGRAGLDVALLRFVAEAIDAGDYEEARGVYRRGVRASVAWSAGLAVLVAATAPLLSDVFGTGNESSNALRGAALLVPIQAALQIHLQVLNGLRHPLLASFTTLIIPPALASGLIWSWTDVTPTAAILLSTVAAAIGTGIAAIGIARLLPTSKKPSRRTLRDVMATAAPLLVVGSAAVVMQWTDVVILGVFRDARDVGIYAPAIRVSLLVSLVLVALNSIVSPQFAAYTQRGRKSLFEKLARQSAMLGAMVALPLAIALWVWAPEIMRIFGQGFERGTSALRILAFGQLINVGTGSVGYALSMAGLESLLKRSSLIVSVGNLLLNLALVPAFGMEGAALATALSLTAINALNTWWVRTRLQVQPLPFLPPVYGRDESPEV